MTNYLIQYIVTYRGPWRGQREVPPYDVTRQPDVRKLLLISELHEHQHELQRQHAQCSAPDQEE